MFDTMHMWLCQVADQSIEHCDSPGIFVYGIVSFALSALFALILTGSMFVVYPRSRKTPTHLWILAALAVRSLATGLALLTAGNTLALRVLFDMSTAAILGLTSYFVMSWLRMAKQLEGYTWGGDCPSRAAQFIWAGVTAIISLSIVVCNAFDVDYRTGKPESTTGTQFIVTTHILMSVFLLILAAIFLWIVNSIRDYILPKGSTKANQKNANSSSSGDVTAGTVGSHADAAVGGVSGYVPPQISMQSHSSPSTSSPSLGNDSILKGLYLSSSSPSNHNNNSSMGPSALVGGVGGVGGAEAGAVALSPPHAHTRQLRLSRDVDGYLRLNGRLALDVRLLSLSIRFCLAASVYGVTIVTAILTGYHVMAWLYMLRAIETIILIIIYYSIPTTSVLVAIDPNAAGSLSPPTFGPGSNVPEGESDVGNLEDPGFDYEIQVNNMLSSHSYSYGIAPVAVTAGGVISDDAQSIYSNDNDDGASSIGSYTGTGSIGGSSLDHHSGGYAAAGMSIGTPGDGSGGMLIHAHPLSFIPAPFSSTQRSAVKVFGFTPGDRTDRTGGGGTSIGGHSSGHVATHGTVHGTIQGTVGHGSGGHSMSGGSLAGSGLGQSLSSTSGTISGGINIVGSSNPHASNHHQGTSGVVGNARHGGGGGGGGGVAGRVGGRQHQQQPYSLAAAGGGLHIHAAAAGGGGGGGDSARLSSSSRRGGATRGHVGGPGGMAMPGGGRGGRNDHGDSDHDDHHDDDDDDNGRGGVHYAKMGNSFG